MKRVFEEAKNESMRIGRVLLVEAEFFEDAN
jgi:hypothetical protein